MMSSGHGGKIHCSCCIAGLIVGILVLPASAAETLTIEPVSEPVIAGDTVEFKGTSSLPAESQLGWSFGTEGFIVEDRYHYYPKDKFRYYDESETTTASTGKEYSKWRVLIHTHDLKPGYYNFRIGGNEAFAERVITVDNEQGIVKDTALSEISPDIDFYTSPNSKFILEGSSGHLQLMPESYRRKVPENFPSPHISSAKTLIRGNSLEMDLFTMPERRIGIWLYSAFPDNSFRYFKSIDSKGYTGEAKIYFDTDVTANLELGDYYVFAEVAGINILETDNFRSDRGFFASLPVIPDPNSEEIWYDPEGDRIVAPASSVALDAALKAGENEIKYLRFRITVEDPWIAIDKMEDVVLGKDIRITGTTNFEKGTVMDVEILPIVDCPSTEAVVWRGEAEVSIDTNGQENWGTSVNTYNLGAGEYIIRVSDREHKLTEDNVVIEIIDVAYGMEEAGEDSLLVRSYSVDPVSKEIVHLNEPVQKSPLSTAVVIAGNACVIGIAGFTRRKHDENQ